MTVEEAVDVLEAAARAVLAKVPSSQWGPAAHAAALRIMKLSHAKASQSGAYRLQDDTPTQKETPRSKHET